MEDDYPLAMPSARTYRQRRIGEYVVAMRFDPFSKFPAREACSPTRYEAEVENKVLMIY
jgi:hypothetical protein